MPTKIIDNRGPQAMLGDVPSGSWALLPREGASYLLLFCSGDKYIEASTGAAMPLSPGTAVHPVEVEIMIVRDLLL